MHPGCSPMHPGCNPAHPGASQHASHRAERWTAHVPPHVPPHVRRGVVPPRLRRGRVFGGSTPASATDHSGAPRRLACRLHAFRAVSPSVVASSADGSPSAAACSSCCGTDAGGGLQAQRDRRLTSRGCVQHLSAGYRDAVHPCPTPVSGWCFDAATDRTVGVSAPGAARALTLILNPKPEPDPEPTLTLTTNPDPYPNPNPNPNPSPNLAEPGAAQPAPDRGLHRHGPRQRLHLTPTLTPTLTLTTHLSP